MPHLPLNPLWLEGRYQVVGQAPDGDSLRFIPDHPEELNHPGFERVRFHPEGGFTLRLDGIDAPETHYLGKNGLGVLRQPGTWPHRAAMELLSHLGFGSLLRRVDETVIQAEPTALRGSVALTGADRFGRGLGLAFPSGARPHHNLVQHSANAHLVAQGLAYPTFYSDTPELLRAEITRLALNAREQNRGLWPQDVTGQGFHWQSLPALTLQQMILPKLFRRLVDFAGLMQGNDKPEQPFLQFCNQLSLEVGTVKLLPQALTVEFTDLLEEQQGLMKLLVAPELILFPEN